jgi:hypothetical protein
VADRGAEGQVAVRRAESESARQSRSDAAWKRADRKWAELMPRRLQARAEAATAAAAYAEGEAEAPPVAGACSPPLPPLPPHGDDDDDGPPLLCGSTSGTAAIKVAALVVA